MGKVDLTFSFFALSFFLQHRKVWNCLGLIDSITAISFQVLHNTHLANDVDRKCSECYDQQKYQQSHPSHIMIVADVAGAKTNHLEGNPMFQRRDSHLTLICPAQAILPFLSHYIFHWKVEQFFFLIEEELFEYCFLDALDWLKSPLYFVPREYPVKLARLWMYQKQRRHLPFL